MSTGTKKKTDRVRMTVHLLLEECGCKTRCISSRCGCRKKGRICSPGCRCRNTEEEQDTMDTEEESDLMNLT